MEQDLRIDPKTGFMFSDRRAVDAHQNDNYTRHTNPADTARDFSRPHTIPKEEFEQATGKSHDEAIREWETNEQTRQDAEARQAQAA